MSDDPTRVGGMPPQGPPQGPSGDLPEDPAAGERKSRTPLIIGGIAAVILLIGIGVVLSGVLGGDDDDEAEGEVFLSPAASVGPDPFSADPLAMPPDPNLAQPVSGGPVDVSGSTSVTGEDGAKPGLYGGHDEHAACDPQQIEDFLAANPDKAQAWVDALDADPTVALPDGRPLTVALIPEYLDSLTTMVLTEGHAGDQPRVQGRAGRPRCSPPCRRAPRCSWTSGGCPGSSATAATRCCRRWPAPAPTGLHG